MSDLCLGSEVPDPQGTYCSLLFHKMYFMSVFHCYPENNNRELEVPLATARSPNASLPLRVSKRAGLWDTVSCTQYYTFCGVTSGAFHPLLQTVRGYLQSTVTPRFGDKYSKYLGLW